MKNFKIILNNTIKTKNIIFFLLGGIAFSFKYISKWELYIFFLFILIIINLLKKILKLSVSSQSLLKHLNWILIPLFIYSFIFEIKIIGLLMIAHFFSDPIAQIIRNNIKPFRYKFLPKDINGSLFFILSYYVLSLLYIYLLDGFILKKYIYIFLINSVYLGLIENSFKIKNHPDNFNINIFGPIFIYIFLAVNFRLKISNLGFNLIFGLTWCLIPIIILIFFDIINLKKSYIYYLFFLLLYTGFGYHLFLFNIFILAGIGVVKKINQSLAPALNSKSTFIEINEIKEYFLLPFILVIIYFFISPLKILKMSMVAGLTTGLLHYFFHNLDSYISKKYFYLKKIKISREILLYNIALSLLFLFAGYYLNLIKFIPLIHAFLIINILMILYSAMQLDYFNIANNKIMKFLIPYFSFKIFFLSQLL